ncbi:MAG: SDR family oxidoreductase [Chloroflexi bacterium]|nr:SDR family oxidoreductase [Chloroflexota bacterium]MDA1219301.1 SDR family oxidoreductase [Chloroflexota bacterium]
MNENSGRVALVTGASRGIGAATARLLGESGFAVGVNFLSMEDKAQEVVASIKATGGRAMALQSDVRDQASVETMIQATVAAYGSIDVLVNNAMGELPSKPFAELVWEDFQTLIDVQIRGAVNCCQSALPLMETQGRGSIVNIISTYALGAPPARMSAYVTAKSALLGLTKALAVEYTAKGIRVNMVSPGPTETDLLGNIPARLKDMMAAQNPMKRLAQPEDCARAVLFLATDQSEYMSGANLVVSGGQVVL